MQAIDRVKSQWLLDAEFSVWAMEADGTLAVKNPSIIDNGDFVDASVVAEITCRKNGTLGQETTVSFSLRKVVKLKAFDVKQVSIRLIQKWEETIDLRLPRD